MKQLALIQEGHSQYDDRLWAMLGECPWFPWPDAVFSGIDYFEFLPYLALAGASVETEHDPMQTFYVTIPEDREDAFYEALAKYLADRP